LRIEIIPVGPIDSSVLEYLVNLLAERFNTDVEVGPRIPIELFQINELRKQYLSTSILQAIRDLRRRDRRVSLAIADVDLYVSPLNFVFGEADPANGVAVISLARLRRIVHGSQNDRVLLLERAGKEAVHELGHVFHLEHCIQPRCVMFFSNSVADTDFKKNEFCDDCRSMLTFHASSGKS